jgi:hypothetical protein
MQCKLHLSEAELKNSSIAVAEMLDGMPKLVSGSRWGGTSRPAA